MQKEKKKRKGGRIKQETEGGGKRVRGKPPALLLASQALDRQMEQEYSETKRDE